MHSAPYDNNYLFVFISYILCFPYVLLHCMVFVSIFDNQQIYYLINLYFFVACLGQLKSVLTRYLGTLLGFQNYELLDFILQRDLFNRILYSWNIQGIFLYSIFPEHYLGLFPGMFGTFSKYSGNVMGMFHEYSTNLYLPGG